MKKQILLSILTCLTAFGFAQDKIVKLSGEIITCTIIESSEVSVRFSYEGETLTNSISTNIIKEVVLSSGRIIDYNEKVIIHGEEDWEKVKITSLESDVFGLTSGEEMMAKASSGWSTTNQGKMQKKAMNKLKKQAASKGYHMVLLLTTTGKGGHYGLSGGSKSSVTGTGYKY